MHGKCIHTPLHKQVEQIRTDAFSRTARVLVLKSSLKWHSFMFLVLFCSYSTHFSEIQLVCDRRTDGRTCSYRDARTHLKTSSHRSIYHLEIQQTRRGVIQGENTRKRIINVWKTHFSAIVKKMNYRKRQSTKNLSNRFVRHLPCRYDGWRKKRPHLGMCLHLYASRIHHLKKS